MFGDTELWVTVIEWGDLDDLEINVETTLERSQAVARGMVIEKMNSTVPEYNPDGCRDFILSDVATLMGSDHAPDGTLVSDLDDAAWLAELHDQTTVPWITIERHVVAINPVSN